MQTARQRAEEFVKKFLGAVEGPVNKAAVEHLTLSFKEHARNQRHLCVESVGYDEMDSMAGCVIKSGVESAVMNTRAPGE